MTEIIYFLIGLAVVYELSGIKHRLSDIGDTLNLVKARIESLQKSKQNGEEEQ